MTTIHDHQGRSSGGKLTSKLSEDWLAVIIGFIIVLIAAAGIVSVKMIPWKLV
jgi:hypothetical protein